MAKGKSPKSSVPSDHENTVAPPAASSTSDVSRRSILAGAVVGGVTAAGARFSNFVGAAEAKQNIGDENNGNGSGDLRLVNGDFVDHRGEVAKSMTIKNGRIAALDQSTGLGPDGRTINLHGRTVIPGFSNGHIHHSRTGRNPGHEERDIETATSIAEIQELLARRAGTISPGQWTGCHLGWHYVQLAENRPPTKAELDAAAPNNPVFLSGRARAGGPGNEVEAFFSVTNSLGQPFFENLGFTFDANGRATNATPEALRQAIQDTETPEDNMRQTFDNNAWTLSNGLTNLLDSSGSPVTAQDFPALELWRQGRLHLRHRLNYSASQSSSVTGPERVEARSQNMFRELGDDLLRGGGFGETIGSRQDRDVFEATGRAIAAAGWKGQHHTDLEEQAEEYIERFVNISEDFDLAPLRWQLIHCHEITGGQAEQLKDLGVGCDLENEQYLNRLERDGGPFFRDLVDSGVNIGIGTDGSNFAPNNPWVMMYYMTTGVDVAAFPNNTDQVITRMEALGLFTAGSAFQLFDDDKLGSFDVGKHADLAVLSDDFRAVTDAQLKKIKSVLTLVKGKIVHMGDAPQYSEIGEVFEYTGT